MFSNYLQNRISAFKQIKAMAEIETALQLQISALKKRGKILVFGNGGSATQAMHYSAELVNKFYLLRRALPALALNTDVAALTAIANDLNYEDVFSRQIEALCNTGDVLLGLTTSGRSKNVLRAIETGNKIGAASIVLCGKNINELKAVQPKIIISFPLDDTPLLQELHLICLHYFAREIEKSMEEKNEI